MRLAKAQFSLQLQALREKVAVAQVSGCQQVARHMYTAAQAPITALCSRISHRSEHSMRRHRLRATQRPMIALQLS